MLSLLQPLLGGALIGVAVSLLLGLNGQIAGVSGILGRVVSPLPPGEAPGGVYPWRLAFLGAMVGVGALLQLSGSSAVGAPVLGSLPGVVAAGLLVGAGTRLGGGCTSGHGICGLSSGAPRSLVAVLTFMGVGALTAAALGWWGVRL